MMTGSISTATISAAPTSPATTPTETPPATAESMEAFLGFNLDFPEGSVFEINWAGGRAFVDLPFDSSTEAETFITEAMVQAGFEALPSTPTPETKFLNFTRADMRFTIMVSHTAPEEVGLLFTKTQ